MRGKKEKKKQRKKERKKEKLLEPRKFVAFVLSPLKKGIGMF